MPEIKLWIKEPFCEYWEVMRSDLITSLWKIKFVWRYFKSNETKNKTSRSNKAVLLNTNIKPYEMQRCSRHLRGRWRWVWGGGRSCASDTRAAKWRPQTTSGAWFIAQHLAISPPAASCSELSFSSRAAPPTSRHQTRCPLWAIYLLARPQHD